jgi:hypothetical protein
VFVFGIATFAVLVNEAGELRDEWLRCLVALLWEFDSMETKKEAF